MVACVANFSGQPHEDYVIGLPAGGHWDEVVNTDAYNYYGSGVGNLGSVEAAEEPRHGLPYSAHIRVPPLGALWLRYTGPLTVQAEVDEVVPAVTDGADSPPDPAEGRSLI
jgi:1,4-alpha-glucan branching enzyme